MAFRYKLSLNERYPDNPYRDMKLCDKCYREVYENAPVLLVENSSDDKSVVTNKKPSAEEPGEALKSILMIGYAIFTLIATTISYNNYPDAGYWVGVFFIFAIIGYGAFVGFDDWAPW
jgi:hypothetical protein